MFFECLVSGETKTFESLLIYNSEQWRHINVVNVVTDWKQNVSLFSSGYWCYIHVWIYEHSVKTESRVIYLFIIYFYPCYDSSLKILPSKNLEFLLVEKLPGLIIQCITKATMFSQLLRDIL